MILLQKWNKQFFEESNLGGGYKTTLLVTKLVVLLWVTPIKRVMKKTQKILTMGELLLLQNYLLAGNYKKNKHTNALRELYTWCKHVHKTYCSIGSSTLWPWQWMHARNLNMYHNYSLMGQSCCCYKWPITSH